MNNRASIQKKRLNKQWRSWPNIPAWTMAVFGLLPLSSGLALIALGSDWLPVKLKEPAGFIVIPGLLFLICGLWVFVLGLRPIFRQSRLDTNLAPYLKDYPWTPGGIDGDFESSLGRSAFNALAIGSFLLPFDVIAWWIGTNDESGKLLLYIVVGFFNLIFLGYLYQLLGYAWQGIRFGKPSLNFDRFPFYLGDTLELSFRNPRGLGAITLSMTLRCIEEMTGYLSKYDVEGQIVCEQIYAEWKEVRTNDSGEADVSFNLPPDAPGTKLKAKMPVYWELLVESLDPNLKYRRVFLLPIYKALPG